MVKYKVAEIKPDTHFNSDVMLDSLFLLATPPCAVTPEVLSCLKKWGFLEVYSEDEKILSKIEEDKNPEKTEHKKISLGETESVDLSEFTDEEDSVPEEQIPEKFKTSEEVDLYFRHSRARKKSPAASSATADFSAAKPNASFSESSCASATCLPKFFCKRKSADSTAAF